MKTITCITLTLMLVTAFAVADEPIESRLTISDLSWMTGRWVGEAFDGVCEEVWNPPLGPSMTGSFKLVINDKVGFYEIMTLTIDKGEPSLRLKHFNADLTGWEEKEKVVSFDFKGAGNGLLEFDGLTYQLTHPDSLIITVGTKDPTGKAHQTIIRCHQEN